MKKKAHETLKANKYSIYRERNRQPTGNEEK